MSGMFLRSLLAFPLSLRSLHDINTPWERGINRWSETHLTPMPRTKPEETRNSLHQRRDERERERPPAQLIIALNMQLSMNFVTRNSSDAIPADPIPGKRPQIHRWK